MINFPNRILKTTFFLMLTLIAGGILTNSALAKAGGGGLVADITAPANNAVIKEPVNPVHIVGTATGENATYQVFYGVGDNPKTWIPLCSPTNANIDNNVLANWPPQDLTHGVYTLKLVVTSADGVTTSEKKVEVLVEKLAVSIIILPYDYYQGEPMTPIVSGLSISGNRLLWGEAHSGNAALHVYDLITKREKIINAWSWAPRIYGNYVLYQKPQDSNLYIYDLAIDTKRQITALADEFSNPAISGSRIVWVDKRGGDLDIFLYDLSNDTERQITNDDGDQMNPSIFGNRIVWKDVRNYPKNPWGNYSNFDIYLYDLTNDTEQKIASASSIPNYSKLSIFGDYIVWSTFMPYDTYLYDLGHPEQGIRKIYAHERAGGAEYPRAIEPVIFNHYLAFQEEGTKGGVYFYDIKPDIAQRFTITNMFDQQFPGSVSGNRIAWGRFLYQPDETGMPKHEAYEAHIEMAYAPQVGLYLEPIGNKFILPGKTLKFDILAVNSDLRPVTFTVSYLNPADINLRPISNANFTFDGDHGVGTFTWTADSDQKLGEYPVHFEVTNGTETRFEDITIGVVEKYKYPPPPPPPPPNPVITINLDEHPGVPYVVEPKILFRVTFKATDPQGDTNLTYAATGLPPKAKFTPPSGYGGGSSPKPAKVEWKPTKKDRTVNPYEITLQATNSKGLTGEKLIKVAVKNFPPVLLNLPAEKKVKVGKKVTLIVHAKDKEMDKKSYTVTPLPPANEGSFDSNSGKFVWTPKTAGEKIFTFTATDAYGATSESKEVKFIVK